MESSQLRGRYDMVWLMSQDMVFPDGERITQEINALLPQLSTRSPILTPRQVLRTIESGHLLVVRDLEKPAPFPIVGMVTLFVTPKLMGTVAHIEDVVVNKKHRGQGLSNCLLASAHERARGEGALTVELTSNFRRETAIRKYLEMGYQRRDTNCFEFNLVGK